MKKNRAIIEIICLFALFVLILLLLLNNRPKHKYSCHDDNYFDNGFLEAINDNNLEVDIYSSEFEENYEDAYNALIDKDFITENYDNISEEQIYISGYLTAVKAFNFDSSKIDINFNIKANYYCFD